MKQLNAKNESASRLAQLHILYKNEGRKKKEQLNEKNE